MNPSTPEQPRFVCRVVRAWLSIFSGDQHGGSAATRSRHVACCPACREYFSAVDSLDHALKRDAVREYEPTPDGLERMIMQAVLRPTPARVEQRNNSRLWIFSLASVTAAAVVTGVVFLRSPSPSRDDSEVAALTDAVKELPGLIRTRIQPSAEELAPKLTSENPLLQEVTFVRDDARSALAFLAANFLPTGVLASSGSTEAAPPATDRG